MQTENWIKTYKYQSVDKSPLSFYVLNPYWNWATTLFPLWVAPNLITLAGLAFTLSSTILAINFDHSDYFSIFYAFALWIYSTLDNIDGKQSRRTNSSSPLGELFDHSIDSLNCCLGVIILRRNRKTDGYKT